MSEELSRDDVENIILVLGVALNYDSESLDTSDEDVLRWESEGGSPS